MNARFIITRGISTQCPAQVRLPEYDHVVETFPADRADQPLDVRILPRRSGSDRLVPNAHGAQTLPENRAIRRVPVPNKITRCTISRSNSIKPQWLISWNSASNLELAFSRVVGTVINIQERPTSSRKLCGALSYAPHNVRKKKRPT
jgi:hypothetical protein